MAALGLEDDLLGLLGDAQVLLAQLLAGGQRRTDGLAVLLRVEEVHVGAAAREAERLALVALLVERPAHHRRLAGAHLLLLEADVARLRAADGELAQRAQVALVR